MIIKTTKTILFSILIASLTLSITSCGDSSENLKAQVFAIHDEVMPKMDEIYKYRTNLLEVKANGTADKKSLSDEEKAEISQVCDSLTVAQIAMEDWMHNYKPDIDNATSSEKTAYFTAELPKIQKVRSTMLRIIELGKTTCQKYPKIEKEEENATTNTQTVKTGTETSKTTSTETSKTEVKPDGKISVKTVEKTTETKSPTETTKMVEKTTETTEKNEKLEKTPIPPPPAPPAPATMKAVQPKVSSGATKVPR